MDLKNKRTLGSTGEEAASVFLINNGYKIADKNFRVGRLGEIDIIANEGEYICFIEVKTRTNKIFGMPSEAVTRSKQEKITRLASVYLSKNKLDGCNVRFDVVEVIGKRKGTEFDIMDINLIKNAF